MKKKVVVIHTFLYSVEDIKSLFNEILPDVEMINIIDDSLLKEVLATGHPTPGVIRRMTQYALQAEAMGADAILNQCSSVSEVVNIVQKMLSIPYLRIDSPMAEEAVRLGSKIGVVATAHSTLDPTCRLVESTAQRLSKDVVVERCFAEGAYDALLKEKNREKHNKIVLKTIRQAAEKNDVVVLAQGSMYPLLPLLKDEKVPVLASLKTGVKQLRDLLYS
jgi:Asp/Glu/hydantoin racemase